MPDHESILTARTMCNGNHFPSSEPGSVDTRKMIRCEPDEEMDTTTHCFTIVKLSHSISEIREACYHRFHRLTCLFSQELLTMLWLQHSAVENSPAGYRSFHTEEAPTILMIYPSMD